MVKAPTGQDRPYHHGNVRSEVLAAALAVISADGTAQLSLRSLSRRVGVTHGAAAHHFGDKAGLLTAIAAEGFELLATYLEGAAAAGDFGDVGLAYVRFAVEHPARFDVMYRPEMYRRDDPAVVAGRTRAGAVLFRESEQVADATGGDAQTAGIAGWALVHGIATLWRDGNLPPTCTDPVALAAQLNRFLFQGSKVAPRVERERDAVGEQLG